MIASTTQAKATQNKKMGLVEAPCESSSRDGEKAGPLDDAKQVPGPESGPVGGLGESESSGDDSSSISGSSGSSSEDEAPLKIVGRGPPSRGRGAALAPRGPGEKALDRDSDSGSKDSGSPEHEADPLAAKVAHQAAALAALVATERRNPPTSFRPSEFSAAVLHEAALWVQREMVDAGRRTLKPLRGALEDPVQRDAVLFGYERARARVEWPQNWSTANRLHRITRSVQGALERRAGEDPEGKGPISLVELCGDLRKGKPGPSYRPKAGVSSGPLLHGRKGARTVRGGSEKGEAGAEASKGPPARSPLRARGGRPNLSRGSGRAVVGPARRVMMPSSQGVRPSPPEGKRVRDVVLEALSQGEDQKVFKHPRGDGPKEGLCEERPISLSSAEESGVRAPIVFSRVRSAEDTSMGVEGGRPLESWRGSPGESQSGSPSSGPGPWGAPDPLEPQGRPGYGSAAPGHSPWGASPYPFNLREGPRPDVENQRSASLEDAVASGHLLDNPARWRRDERVVSYGGGPDVTPGGEQIRPPRDKSGRTDWARVDTYPLFNRSMPSCWVRPVFDDGRRGFSNAELGGPTARGLGGIDCLMWANEGRGSFCMGCAKRRAEAVLEADREIERWGRDYRNPSRPPPISMVMSFNRPVSRPKFYPVRQHSCLLGNLVPVRAPPFGLSQACSGRGGLNGHSIKLRMFLSLLLPAPDYGEEGKALVKIKALFPVYGALAYYWGDVIEVRANCEISWTSSENRSMKGSGRVMENVVATVTCQSMIDVTLMILQPYPVGR